MGDKFPGPVKAAILATLRLLLDKGGAKQKPFFPQMQKAFVKALGDGESGPVRAHAAAALGQLTGFSDKVRKSARVCVCAYGST